MVLAWWQEWLISNGYELVALWFRISFVGQILSAFGLFCLGCSLFCGLCLIWFLLHVWYWQAWLLSYRQVTAVSLVSVWQIHSEHWVHFSYGQLALLITFTSDNDIG